MSHLRYRSDWFIIAINDTYTVAPWADLLYACDFKWWSSPAGQKAIAEFSGPKWTIDEQAAREYFICLVNGRQGNGMQLYHDYIHVGQNSGHQAVNIAVRYGARKIALLGFDHKFGKDKTHFFGTRETTVHSNYEQWMEHWTAIATQATDYGIEIVNCTPDSRIKCFRTSTLDDELK